MWVIGRLRRWVEKCVEMVGDPSPLQPLLTGFVQISRYYVYILFSRCEHTASLNPQGAAHGGKTVSLCLPASLDSLCLTLCTLLCIFWLPVLVNDVKVRAEGRCSALCVITRWLELLEVIKCTQFLLPQCTLSPYLKWELSTVLTGGGGPFESTVWVWFTISGMSEWQFSKRLV